MKYFSNSLTFGFYLILNLFACYDAYATPPSQVKESLYLVVTTESSDGTSDQAIVYKLAPPPPVPLPSPLVSIEINHHTEETLILRSHHYREGADNSASTTHNHIIRVHSPGFDPENYHASLNTKLLTDSSYDEDNVIDLVRVKSSLVTYGDKVFLLVDENDSVNIAWWSTKDDQNRVNKTVSLPTIPADTKNLFPTHLMTNKEGRVVITHLSAHDRNGYYKRDTIKDVPSILSLAPEALDVPKGSSLADGHVIFGNLVKEKKCRVLPLLDAPLVTPLTENEGEQALLRATQTELKSQLAAGSHNSRAFLIPDYSEEFAAAAFINGTRDPILFTSCVYLYCSESDHWLTYFKVKTNTGTPSITVFNKKRFSQNIGYAAHLRKGVSNVPFTGYDGLPTEGDFPKVSYIAAARIVERDITVTLALKTTRTEPSSHRGRTKPDPSMAPTKTLEPANNEVDTEMADSFSEVTIGETTGKAHAKRARVSTPTPEATLNSGVNGTYDKVTATLEKTNEQLSSSMKQVVELSQRHATATEQVSKLTIDNANLNRTCEAQQQELFYYRSQFQQTPTADNQESGSPLIGSSPTASSPSKTPTIDESPQKTTSAPDKIEVKKTEDPEPMDVSEKLTSDTKTEMESQSTKISATSSTIQTENDTHVIETVTDDTVEKRESPTAQAEKVVPSTTDHSTFSAPPSPRKGILKNASRGQTEETPTTTEPDKSLAVQDAIEGESLGSGSDSQPEISDSNSTPVAKSEQSSTEVSEQTAVSKSTGKKNKKQRRKEKQRRDTGISKEDVHTAAKVTQE